LTDTFTTKAFFEDFDFTLANNFSGVRQDSGDCIEFGKNIIAHYKKLGIDPRTKTIVFSDGLDIPKAISIYKEFVGKIGLSFGVGTNLTNSLGPNPLNIVIKMIECNGRPVVKLSDNVTKAIGDNKVVESVKKAYGL
jgi:nicotinate phosphoribosyltransferase